MIIPPPEHNAKLIEEDKHILAALSQVPAPSDCYVAVVNFQNPITGSIENRVKICEPITTVEELVKWKKSLGKNIVMTDIFVTTAT